MKYLIITFLMVGVMVTTGSAVKLPDFDARPGSTETCIWAKLDGYRECLSPGELYIEEMGCLEAERRTRAGFKWESLPPILEWEYHEYKCMREGQ